MNGAKLRIVPLGGLGEVGKNMLALEYQDDIIVIDAGLMFPSEDMLGIDLVIPDVSYLVERRQHVKGLIITHGHEDHCGALPYILPQLPVPVYSTKLTQGLISVKLKEGRAVKGADLRTVKPGERITLGRFKVEFFAVCHSIPDAVGLIIHTPLGIVVHTGDFKLDHTPVDGKLMDFARLAQVSREGVLLLFSDSTYVELPGYTPSEQVVGATLEHIIMQAKGRVIVTTFASLVSRIQQLIDIAAKHGRRVCIVGRSMSDVGRMALELGYLTAPEGILAKPEDLRTLAPEKVMLLTTGSQGEPTSALVRIANKDHRQVHIIPGDTVIISATPIPGNEAVINRTLDSLFKQGANVFYDKVAQVHVHGHGSQEELKMVLSLLKPRFFVPIHGAYRHLSLHRDLAAGLGIPRENIFVLEDGDVLEVGARKGKVVGKIPYGNIYVDGLNVGPLGGVVLRDRRMLSREGVVVVILAIDKQTGKLAAPPDIVARGVVDTDSAKGLIDMAKEVVVKAVGRGGEHPSEFGLISTKVKDALSRFFYEQTRTRPMVLTVVLNV